MQIIGQPLDFFGVNIYHARLVRCGVGGIGRFVDHPPGHARTAIDWPVAPSCLYWLPKFFQERYGLPIYITENGLSNIDWPSRDGMVHDPQRIDFIARHLVELSRAIQDGVNVKGYFHWSLLDNFEWTRGYFDRFGLIYVDYATQRRIVKDSGRWYRELIASRGAHLYGSTRSETT